MEKRCRLYRHLRCINRMALRDTGIYSLADFERLRGFPELHNSEELPEQQNVLDIVGPLIHPPKITGQKLHKKFATYSLGIAGKCTAEACNSEYCFNVVNRPFAHLLPSASAL